MNRWQTLFNAGVISVADMRRLEDVSQPTYRFHGRTPPKDGQRTPILAKTPAGGVDESGTAKLHLYDPIDSWGGSWGVSANEFKDALETVKDAKQINLHINSPGGEVFEGVAILNQLRAHAANVTAVVDGIAASAASFIACGADQTLMARNSQMMIHDASGLVIGNAEDMTQFAGVLNKISDNIASIYSDKAGGTVKDWRKAMLNETWYSDSEAVSAGLADEVDGGSEAVENAFDLSMFKHNGRKDAPSPPIPAQRQASCGCGPDVPGLQHKDECTGTPSLAEYRHRLVAARYRLPL